MITRITGLILCLIALLAPIRVPTAEMRERSILVLDQSEPGGPFYYQTFSGLRSTVNGDTRSHTTLYSESLDLSRFGGPEVHKGRIWRENQQAGGGAVFHLSLPLSPS
jgi:hypothetical protein